MDELGLIDVWRCQHPKEKDFTSFSNVHCSHSRLDMFLMTGVDSYRVTQCNIEAITISDHAPVSLTLKLSPNNNFKYWRANLSILNNEVIQQQIRRVKSSHIYLYSAFHNTDCIKAASQ